MDYQSAFNITLGLAAFFGGWWMKNIWDSIRELQHRDAELTAKVSGIEVLVAGEYVKREEMDRFGTAIFQKLDRIENKLDNKADKV